MEREEYSNRDYLKLLEKMEKMDLYILLQAQETYWDFRLFPDLLRLLQMRLRRRLL